LKVYQVDFPNLLSYFLILLFFGLNWKFGWVVEMI